MPLGTEKSSLLGAAGGLDTFDIEILIVAGGGGGAYFQGGGGGAGGVVHDEDYTVVAGGIEYDLTVGALGAAATVGGSGAYPHTGANGSDGADSVWNVNAEGNGITMTADGGGGGGSQAPVNNGTGLGPQDGGSAGGTGAYNTTAATSTQTSPTGAVGYGNSGGKQASGVYQGEAGGGGAGGVGADGSTGDGGLGGVGKQFPSFMDFGVNRHQQATEYSTGDRRTSAATGYITVSTDLSIYGGEGDIQNFVNGTTTAGGAQFYPNGELVAGKYFRFDFTAYAKPIIVGAKWYQNGASTQGVWKWQGSDDATSWTDIGADFTLGPASGGTQTQTTMSANTTAYRYYQLEGVSGSCVNAMYWLEIEFKDRSYFAGGGGGGTYNAGEGGAGGIGGGGSNGGAATANTGGGGAGGRRSAAPGAGGTGVILIRYLGSPIASGGTETESGGYTYHAYTSTGSATFTTD